MRSLGFDNVVQDEDLQSFVAAALGALPPGVPRLLWLRAGDGVDHHRGDLNPLETYMTDLCERRFEMHTIQSLSEEQRCLAATPGRFIVCCIPDLTEKPEGLPCEVGIQRTALPASRG
jgi:hypothetical protein